MAIGELELLGITPLVDEDSIDTFGGGRFEPLANRLQRDRLGSESAGEPNACTHEHAGAGRFVWITFWRNLWGLRSPFGRRPRESSARCGHQCDHAEQA